MPRVRIPTQQKIAEGNKGKRKLEPEKEPQFSTQNISPIMPLGELGQKEWDRFVPILTKAKVMTDADTAAFTVYCQNYELFCRAKEDVDSSDLAYSTVNGGLSQHPSIRTMTQASTIMLKFFTEFGLTPASRSKVTVDNSTTTVDPFAEFQKERGERRGELRTITGSKKTA